MQKSTYFWKGDVHVKQTKPWRSPPWRWNLSPLPPLCNFNSRLMFMCIFKCNQMVYVCACCVIHLNEMRRSIGLFASLVSKLEFVVLCASLRLGRCTVTCWLNCQLLFHRACMERYHFQIHKGFWRHRGKRKPISNRPTDKLVCVGSNRTLCTKPFSNRHLQSIKESKSPTLFILTSVFVQLRHRLYSFLFWKPKKIK